jgi:alpha-glucosidase
MRFEGDQFRVAETMPSEEHYFGLGDKTGAFDRREQAFRLWNTDAYAWQESTDPLYKSIPFYLSYRAGTSLGVLIDNTWPSSFDFGKTIGYAGGQRYAATWTGDNSATWNHLRLTTLDAEEPLV